MPFRIGPWTFVGYGKSRDADARDGTNWSSSTVNADKGDLILKVGGTAMIIGSSLSAGHDIGIDASSVAFRAVSRSLKQTQDSMSSYYGVSGGLTGDSVLGSVVQSALAASHRARAAPCCGPSMPCRGPISWVRG
ncbi:hypothetical protein [Parasaccharibacter apium]|uniref:hypothetical protein n=1 Tax=Parasaccharibacter apium TaxID=1510841 RepID=UPI0011AF2095|nr:hypothetical protein [Parasaccharibacter apium]